MYNPKAADRLGVVYTPNEIVRFMVESADWLCERHFGRGLIDKDVDILDPAAGTGTFVCEIIEHFRGSKERLRQKYQQELHANEVAILPYYVANLNIEASYAAIMDGYQEFPGLCFVDTLDNTFALRKYKGHQEDLFGISDDNIKRIRQQNSRRISVIIGNPPYNANQLNENENNKNREYFEIDRRIKETYIKASTAQKTKLYDMYARFFRWASDRVDENGVLALITNRSFLNGRTFDGFRKVVGHEFNEIRIVDLGGDVRANPKLSGTKHNVFGIQTGVAISFMVKKAKGKGCKIFYARRPEFDTAEDKLTYLDSVKLDRIDFETIQPDEGNNWINLSDVDTVGLVPLIDYHNKTSEGKNRKSIFKLFSNGIVTARDEWMTNFDYNQLVSTVGYFCNKYSSEQNRWYKSPLSKTTDNKRRLKSLSDFISREIKWTSELEHHLDKGTKVAFHASSVRKTAYRPYVNCYCYYARVLTHRLYRQNNVFPVQGEWENLAIGFSGLSSSKPFQALAVDKLPSYDFLEKTQFLPLYSYDINGNKTDNVTDWAVQQFKKHYQDKRISKRAVFCYVYGVLHDPVYREKYALDLKRNFPRIPFYKEFRPWTDWGESLLEFHVGYESIRPHKLKRVETNDSVPNPACKLKANKEAGSIILDTKTTLTGIPKAVWEYRLGNRSALEWVLDQYKESKPKDPTIRQKFNTYRFASHKEHVIDLLARITAVSVETMKVIEQMKQAERE